MRTILGSLTLLTMICGLALADDKIEPSKLIGKWELVIEAKKTQSLTLEFHSGMKISVLVGDVKLDGTYSIYEDNKMDVSLKFMGEDHKESLTIRKLSADELITEDSKGKSETFKKKKG